jgi:signal recognition particle subunit SRP68
VKKYGEALALLQHSTIHVREAVSSLSLSESDFINNGNASFFPLNAEDIKEVESAITSDNLQLKRDWFAYNGGSVKADPTTYKKPLFFNIALNYVELDMDRLQQRAGKQPVPAPAAPSSSCKGPQARTESVPEKKPTPKAKAEEHVEPTPEPKPQARGGLSNLLGGWWNKGY